MYSIEVIIVAIIAIIARILIQNKSFVLPTVYREGNVVRFNWGSLGVIVVGLLTIVVGGDLDPSVLTSPLAVFSLVYTLPAISDAIATELIPNDYEHPLIEDLNKEEEVA